MGHFFGEKPNVSLYRRVLPLKLQLTLAILLVASILVLGFNLLIENRSNVAQDSRHILCVHLVPDSRNEQRAFMFPHRAVYTAKRG